MSREVEFFFDFSSPYGYLAACRLSAWQGGPDCRFLWRPILLGAVFKITGQKPLAMVPFKGDYMLHDVARSARRLGVSWQMPANFPFPAVAASRAFYWADDQDPAKAVRFARACYRQAFGEGADITAPESLAPLADEAGLDAAALAAACQDQVYKDRLRAACDQAIEREIFGSPTFVVDGERFWGFDRMDDLAAWIESGGW